MINNNNNLYADNSKLDNLTEQQKLSCLNESFNFNENDVRKLTNMDKESMITSLHEFKTNINNIQNEEKMMIFENMLDYVKIFKERNIASDQKWEQIRSNINKNFNNSTNTNEETITDLTNISVASSKVQENSPIIKEISKPLGTFGDNSINDVLSMGIEAIKPLSDFFKNNTLEVSTVISILPAYFMYKGVVNMYTNIAFKEKPINLKGLELINYNSMKAKELRAFMVLGAPLIVGSLYVIKNITHPINIKIGSTSITEENKIFKDGSVISSLFFLSNKRLPNWFKDILKILLSIIFVKLIFTYSGLSESSSLFLLGNIKLIKWFFILGSVTSLIMIFYYIFSMYLYIMFSKNKINNPIYLPQFVLDWLKNIKNISQSEHKGIYIEFYFKLILVYIFILFLTLLVLFNLNNIIT